ncbi:MAG: glycosyltransferase family 2 protein [Hallerella sp.]|uniref:Alpha-1,3-rhamnosyltransferase n=1 Tax=Hallerella porci TaxID=1945871 RepID=A0ABX5LL18_9BACT|nr:MULTISPECIES: glycosyltransferase family A protein [Hallerella]MCI5601255.1 glycosyltransferase family 2 protein [Hallerella sp.]PWL01948.1 alpha-1,3-rhamnosyltransferase [Hallerella porci]
MEEPLVSVLLASYNHAPFVEAAVRSILSQSGVAFELIVIDDGSTDNSPQILERLSHEFGFYYKHRENRGLVQTLNEMLTLAHGKYFCTFASDDVMAPGRLAAQSQFLETHPEFAACAGQVKNLRSDGNLEDTVDLRYAKTQEATFEEILLGKAELHGATEMIVKEKFAAVGNYDENFRFEDFPAWLALSYRYGKIPVLRTVCCYYRILETSMHRNLNFIYKQILAVIEKYKNHPAYSQAVALWKTRWFSSLAYNQKREALRKLPQLATCTKTFWMHFPKLFIPRIFLKY